MSSTTGTELEREISDSATVVSRAASQTIQNETGNTTGENDSSISREEKQNKTVSTVNNSEEKSQKSDKSDNKPTGNQSNESSKSSIETLRASRYHNNEFVPKKFVSPTASSGAQAAPINPSLPQGGLPQGAVPLVQATPVYYGKPNARVQGTFYNPPAAAPFEPQYYNPGFRNSGHMYFYPAGTTRPATEFPSNPQVGGHYASSNMLNSFNSRRTLAKESSESSIVSSETSAPSTSSTTEMSSSSHVAESISSSPQVPSKATEEPSSKPIINTPAPSSNSNSTSAAVDAPPKPVVPASTQPTVETTSSSKPSESPKKPTATASAPVPEAPVPAEKVPEASEAVPATPEGPGKRGSKKQQKAHDSNSAAKSEAAPVESVQSTVESTASTAGAPASSAVPATGAAAPTHSTVAPVPKSSRKANANNEPKPRGGPQVPVQQPQPQPQPQVQAQDSAVGVSTSDMNPKKQGSNKAAKKEAPVSSEPATPKEKKSKSEAQVVSNSPANVPATASVPANSSPSVPASAASSTPTSNPVPTAPEIRPKHKEPKEPKTPKNASADLKTTEVASASATTPVEAGKRKKSAPVEDVAPTPAPTPAPVPAPVPASTPEVSTSTQQRVTPCYPCQFQNNCDRRRCSNNCQHIGETCVHGHTLSNWTELCPVAVFGKALSSYLFRNSICDQSSALSFSIYYTDLKFGKGLKAPRLPKYLTGKLDSVMVAIEACADPNVLKLKSAAEAIVGPATKAPSAVSSSATPVATASAATPVPASVSKPAAVPVPASKEATHVSKVSSIATEKNTNSNSNSNTTSTSTAKHNSTPVANSSSVEDSQTELLFNPYQSESVSKKPVGKEKQVKEKPAKPVHTEQHNKSTSEPVVVEKTGGKLRIPAEMMTAKSPDSHATPVGKGHGSHEASTRDSASKSIENSPGTSPIQGPPGLSMPSRNEGPGRILPRGVVVVPPNAGPISRADAHDNSRAPDSHSNDRYGTFDKGNDYYYGKNERQPSGGQYDFGRPPSLNVPREKGRDDYNDYDSRYNSRYSNTRGHPQGVQQGGYPQRDAYSRGQSNEPDYYRNDNRGVNGGMGNMDRGNMGLLNHRLPVPPQAEPMGTRSESRYDFAPPAIPKFPIKLIDTAAFEERKEKNRKNLDSFSLEVRYILNKLTPDNFQKLSNELNSFPITSLGMVEVIANIIFEKSLLEHKFAFLYARLASAYEKENKLAPCMSVATYYGKNEFVWFNDLTFPCQFAGPFMSLEHFIQGLSRIPPLSVQRNTSRDEAPEYFVYGTLDNLVLLKVVKDPVMPSQIYISYITLKELESLGVSMSPRYASYEMAVTAAKKHSSLRRSLANLCGTEFENFNSKSDKYAELTRAQAHLQQSSKTATAKQLAILNEDFENLSFKLKYRLMGVIKLIGELYINDLIVANVIKNCIESLLPSPSSDLSSMGPEIEGFCTLVATVGRAFENKDAANKSFFDKVFVRVLELSTRSTLPYRLKFELQQLSELRNNDWVPRRLEEGPVTLGEIQSKVQEEFRQKYFEELQYQKQQNEMYANKSHNSNDYRRNNNNNNNSNAPRQYDRYSKPGGGSPAPPGLSGDASSSRAGPDSFSTTQKTLKYMVSLMDEYIESENPADIVDSIGQAAPATVSNFFIKITEKFIDSSKPKVQSALLSLLVAIKDYLKPFRNDIVNKLSDLELFKLLPDISIDILRAPELFGQIFKFLKGADIVDNRRVETLVNNLRSENLSFPEANISSVNSAYDRFLAEFRDEGKSAAAR